MQSLPARLAELMNPPLTEVAKLFQVINQQLHTVLDERDGQKSHDVKTPPHRTIFHELLDSDLPASEKDLSRLAQEGILFMTAGTTTTAETLAVVTFYLLQNFDIRQRLQAELSSVSSAKANPTGTIAYPKLQELEQLPFLTAIIKEGLRISHGVVQRLARIHPDTDLEYKEWTIPRGTPVSMSSWMIHTNPSKFPEPHRFVPERWLKGIGSAEFALDISAEAEDARLGKYLFSFGKGTRQCVGLNLAYAEVYLGVAAMFTPGNLQFELFETDESDVKLVRDSFIPQVKDGTKGIRVIVN